MDEGPLCASLVPAQVRERKWRRALPQRRGRAGGWPQGRAAGSLGLPTPSHRGHSQHPGLRAGGALLPSEEHGRDPALLGGSVLETGVPRAEWLLPRDMMAAGDWPAPLRWGSGPGPSHRGPWVLFEPQPGDALPLSACGQPSPPPTCWGLGKRRWEEVGAWGPHASRGGREELQIFQIRITTIPN